MSRFAAAAAVNDQQVLGRCLAASPDIASGAVALSTYQGFASASSAYNVALDEAAAEIVMLVHQDVYLPAGYFDRLEAQLRALDQTAPDWAVAGVIGADRAGMLHGRVWSTGLGQIIGEEGSPPTRVEAIDEMIILIRKDAGIRFDERLPGYHLYAADIIQIAEARGRSTWVVDAPAVHHSRPVIKLDSSYKRAWYYLRRKWREKLPIRTLVCPITRSPLEVLLGDLRLRLKVRGRARRGSFDTTPPKEIARRLGFEA